MTSQFGLYGHRHGLACIIHTSYTTHHLSTSRTLCITNIHVQLFCFAMNETLLLCSFISGLGVRQDPGSRLSDRTFTPRVAPRTFASHVGGSHSRTDGSGIAHNTRSCRAGQKRQTLNGRSHIQTIIWKSENKATTSAEDLERTNVGDLPEHARSLHA